MSTATKNKKVPVKTSGERPKAVLASPKKWDGESLYKECKAQGIYPSFDSGNFTGFLDKQTGKKVSTQLPTMTAVVMEAYRKAEQAAVEAAKNAKQAKAPKAEKPKKEKAVKVPGASRSRLDPTKKIHILAKANPKREGTGAHKAWEKMTNGMLVADYLAIDPEYRARLAWDVTHGNVELK